MIKLWVMYKSDIEKIKKGIKKYVHIDNKIYEYRPDLTDIKELDSGSVLVQCVGVIGYIEQMLGYIQLDNGDIVKFGCSKISGGVG